VLTFFRVAVKIEACAEMEKSSRRMKRAKMGGLTVSATGQMPSSQGEPPAEVERRGGRGNAGCNDADREVHQFHVVLTASAFAPNAESLFAVVLAPRAESPKAELSLPVVLSKSAAPPKAELLLPVELKMVDLSARP
jgi:hypothetical protein